MKIHRETLSKHKLTMLQKASREVERTGVNIVDIGIFRDNINDYNNWQKLRLHGLITHTISNGVVQRGKWLITRQGWEFLEGKKNLPVWVEVSDNHIVARANKLIGVRDVYHGSEAIVTTFQYFIDETRLGYRPVARQSNQMSLLGSR